MKDLFSDSIEVKPADVPLFSRLRLIVNLFSEMWPDPADAIMPALLIVKLTFAAADQKGQQRMLDLLGREDLQSVLKKYVVDAQTVEEQAGDFNSFTKDPTVPSDPDLSPE